LSEFLVQAVAGKPSDSFSDFDPEDFGSPALSQAAGAKRTLGGAKKRPKGASSEKAEPQTAVFEEFAAKERLKPPEPFKPEEHEGPSLDYLFRPFDPGADSSKEAKFEEMERPSQRVFDYKDLDLRDENIINTLDRANKKAKEIVFGAFEQGRRMEAKVLAAAKLEAEELAGELKAKAEKEAAEILEKAAAEKEAIVQAAAAESLAREEAKQKFEADMAAALQKASELDARSAALDERDKGLDARQAKMDQAEAELAVRKGELEKKFKEESAAALAQSLAKGQAEGLQKGLVEGRAKGRSEVLSKAEGFFKAIEKVGGIYRELWKDKAPMMTRLAVEAAEAIVNKEIEGGQGLAAGALRACVDYLQKCHEVVFKVRPQELAEVESARAELRDRLDGLVNIEFKPDDSLGPGDLVMESDAGRLDATMKARRERVMAVLRDALDQGLVAELPPEPSEASPAAPPSPSATSFEASPSGASPPSGEAASPEGAAPSGPAPTPQAPPNSPASGSQGAPANQQSGPEAAPQAPPASGAAPPAPPAPGAAPPAPPSSGAAPPAPPAPPASETGPQAAPEQAPAGSAGPEAS
jgi:flagellar biosynthesis/type III secretory pathway protein FliH